MRLTFSIALLLAAAATPVLAKDPPADPEWTSKQTALLVEIAREYLAVLNDDSTSRRDEILTRARALGHVSSRRMKEVEKALFKVARSGPKSDGKGECTATFPRFPGTYYLSGGGNRKGVFIGLHGGAPGIGSGRSAQSLWGGASSKGLIGVFPTANLPGMKKTWQTPVVNEFVLAILRELKRTWKIDTNRVYVAGHSLGGSGAWHIGLRYADLWAGVSPNAGGLHGWEPTAGDAQLPGGFIANLYNTPLFVTHFDQDPRVGVADARAASKELAELKAEFPEGYEHVYIEGEGKSHGFPKGGSPAEIITWLTKSKRDPYPKKIVWEPTWPQKRTFFWLRKARPAPGRGRSMRIVATIEKNRVALTGSELRGVSVFLAEKMFDSKKPVTVVVNGEERFSDIIRRDPAALVESIVENIDPAQVFAYRIDL